MKKKCYIYIRVSTTMQVDGYSLEAQKERLMKFAEFQEMDGVAFILVFKLSRFGRNAADVLNSL